jgi:uncharacterized protein YjiS (DUF1127 family)
MTMAAIADDLKLTLTWPARPLLAVMGAVTSAGRRIARAYQNRAQATVLARLDDRMLADIGISRSDVRDAFAEPLWQDPTALLRARALERRLSRQQISLGLQSLPAPPLAPADAFQRPPADRPARFTV